MPLACFFTLRFAPHTRVLHVSFFGNKCHPMPAWETLRPYWHFPTEYSLSTNILFSRPKKRSTTATISHCCRYFSKKQGRVTKKVVKSVDKIRKREESEFQGTTRVTSRIAPLLTPNPSIQSEKQPPNSASLVPVRRPDKRHRLPYLFKCYKNSQAGYLPIS